MCEQILIIRLSSLGDVVLTQPIAASLKKEFPKAEIHFITKKAYLPIIECFDCVDKIHIWEDNKSFSKLRKLAKQKFDLVIDLHNKFNTFLIKKMVNGKKTVTYNKQHLLRKKIVQHKTKETIKSTVDLYFSSLRKIGIKANFFQPKLCLKGKLPEELSNKIQTDELKLAIFPGALHKTKQYPPELLTKVIKKLGKKFTVYLLGTIEERHISVQIQEKLDVPVNNLCGDLSLSELLLFLYEMDVVLTNDSGPMHLAAALQLPQIALFGATHPKLGFAPLNEKAVILSADLNCQPCALHGNTSCPEKHFNCMKMIKPEQIVHNIKKVIKDF